jgi:hypothetical protein
MDRCTVAPERTTLAVALVVVSLLAMLAVGPILPAVAGSAASDGGSCTGSAAWRLTVARHAGSLGVRFKITGSPTGHRWTVFMDNSGWGFFSGSRRASSTGTVVVKKGTRDRSGADRITVAATDRATGETCSGRVRV